MMFGFIDSASEHAVALVNFHHYACFFLVIVITFVVWLLKLVLKFVVIERNLLYVNASFFSHFSRFFFLFKLSSFFQLFLSFFSGNLLELYYVLLVLLCSRKTESSYALNKTLYPDQGIRIDAFRVTPALISTSHDYIRPYKSALFGSYTTLRPRNISLSLLFLRTSLYEIPFLFPYERAQIASYGSWASAEELITYTVFLNSYYTSLKYSSWGLIDSGKLSLSFLKLQTVFFSKTFIKSGKFRVLNLPLNLLVGVGHSLPNGLTDSKLYKNYTWSVNPFFIFSKFYSAESRMFFYLFFQNVKHRKILEWVWTCVPAFILMLLLYPSLSLLYCYDRPYITRPYVTFKSIGHQWYWSYEYSDYVSNGGGLDHIKFDSYLQHEDDLDLGQFRLLEVDRRVVLPVGVCIRMVTTSADVLHSWAVPALGVKIDAVPGRLNQFWIIVDRPGTFYGQCSELCGVNHGFMPIVIEGVSLELFFNYLHAVYATNS